MRAPVCAIVAAIGLAAQPAFAQAERPPAAFWKTVQATCDTTAGKPPSELGKRIAQTALDEFNRFGGHQVDSNGRLFRFGLTEAEHKEDDGGDPRASLGHLGWWQVMKYWRSLFGDNSTTDKLEVVGYRDASTTNDETKVAEVLRTDAASLLRAADNASDPTVREALREAAIRAAVIDTPWSAAFISYVVKQAGAPASAFKFSNAHRTYIYDAFAASAAEPTNTAGDKLYRACPVYTTKPRVGDLLCFQREPSLADVSDEVVRERMRAELASGSAIRSVRRTHCEVVASIDAGASKMYVIGGNVHQGITAKRLNLQRDLKLSTTQTGNCGGAAYWTMPGTSGDTANAPAPPKKCSLNDKKWFVLMQLR